MALDPVVIDFARDALSAVFAGIFVMGLGSVLRYRRNTKQRIERHAETLWHILDHLGMRSIYPRDQL